MYQDWQVERWETPVSDVKSLAMVSLTDCQGHLTIIVQDLRDPQRRRFQFTFEQYPAYRNIMEEYRMELWTYLDRAGFHCGWTMRVQDAPWSRELKQEPVVAVANPTLQHYMICTEDDVIEVLANAAPTIIEIAPADAEEALPGKSIIYYVSRGNTT